MKKKKVVDVMGEEQSLRFLARIVARLFALSMAKCICLHAVVAWMAPFFFLLISMK